MDKSTVVQFEITGTASEKLRQFYATLFGWTMHTTGTPDYARVLASDSGIQGAIGSSWDGGPGQLTVYIEVPNLQQALSRAEELGGSVIDGASEPVAGRVPQWSPELRAYEVPWAGISFAFVADPQGHVIGLSQGLRDALGQFAAAAGH